MDRFLADLSELFSRAVDVDSAGLVWGGIFGVSLIFGTLTAILFIISIKNLFKKQKVIIPLKEPKQKEPETDIDVDVGEFGRIVSDTKVSVKGGELDYFILKKNKYEKDSLPIGTIVVIIKKNGREAYVKPADEKDAKRVQNTI